MTASITAAVSSTVWVRGRLRRDTNGFATALAVRETRLAQRPVPSDWLDALESCQATPTGYCFWPRAATPSWAPMLAPDSDDTAVMALELLIAGRLTVAEARRIACLGVAAHRLTALRSQGPCWTRVGMFATWHRPGARTDLVDCTAAANALAFLAVLGLRRLPGVEATIAAISAAVEWAGDDELRLWSLSPFYPEPDELRRAVSHAVAAGCEALEPVRRALGDPASPDPQAALCSSPYGLITWRSPELQELRRTLR